MKNIVNSLTSFIDMVKIFKEATPNDLSIAICDNEQFLAYLPGKEINLRIQRGQRLQQEEPLMIALQTNKRLEAVVPAQFYGVEFVGTATPLHNEHGHVIGGIAVQSKKHRELLDLSTMMEHSVIGANDKVQTVVQNAASLYDMTLQLTEMSNEATTSIDESEHLLKTLQQMSNQTNVLGLNASIEAARAGQYGRGFQVVAKEIQRFSQQSASNTTDIDAMLHLLKDNIAQMTTVIQHIDDVSKSQERAMQDMTDIVMSIEQMAKQLNQFAQKL